MIMDHWSPAWCRYKSIDSHVSKCVQIIFPVYVVIHLTEEEGAVGDLMNYSSA